MNQQETIRLLYESEGKTLRDISRITGRDFRTVQKYAYREDWRPPEEEALRSENYKVLGPYIPIIDGWLESVFCGSRGTKKRRASSGTRADGSLSGCARSTNSRAAMTA